MPIPTVQVNIVSQSGVQIPEYALDESSGVDLRAFLDAPVTLNVHQRVLIPTGLNMAIPTGYEAQIRSRSGLALNHGIIVLNSPGTIDAGYRGEIKVLLINLGQDPFIIEPHMRMAQCVFTPVVRARFHRVDRLAASERESGGFGSTGTH